MIYIILCDCDCDCIKINKKSDTYCIIARMKKRVGTVLDNPEELMTMINNYLIPNNHEQKTYGEVFTPMNMVNEMLDRLDEHYKEINSSSIFTMKSKKWFDPTNGMGNFIIGIYLRLMKGLEKKIKNESKRKKHIIVLFLLFCFYYFISVPSVVSWSCP